MKVRTLTIESWALAYQPSQTRVQSRKARRTQRYSAGRRTSWSWKKKMPVRISNATAVTPMSQVLARQMRCQSGSSSSPWVAVSGPAPTAGEGCAGAAAAAAGGGGGRTRYWSGRR